MKTKVLQQSSQSPHAGPDWDAVVDLQRAEPPESELNEGGFPLSDNTDSYWCDQGPAGIHATRQMFLLFIIPLPHAAPSPLGRFLPLDSGEFVSVQAEAVLESEFLLRRRMQLFSDKQKEIPLFFFLQLTHQRNVWFHESEKMSSSLASALNIQQSSCRKYLRTNQG